VYELTIYFALLLGLIPIAFFYVKGRNKFPSQAKAFLPFLYLTAIASLYEFFGTNVAGLDVAIWFRIYGLLEFLALLYFFCGVLPVRIHRVLYSLAIIFALEFIFFLFFGDMNEELLIDSILNCTTYSLVITGVMYYFVKRFDMLHFQRAVLDWAVFCFMAGTLLYYSSTFFLFLMAHSVLISNPGNFADYWVLNVIGTIVFRTILIFGIWKG
jgi:hypothetical protein